MKKLIVIVGPTGSGKTDLSIEIAKRFNLEIINSDCYQVYSELNVGVNKPTDNQLNSIKHHLINCFPLNIDWNIYNFKKEAEAIIDKSNQNAFIIAGGSNLYTDALIKNYNLKEENNIKNNYDNLTLEELYNKLIKFDEAEALKIGKNNYRRLKRALEIIDNYNILKSNVAKFNRKPKYDYFLIYIDVDRKKLYEKLDKRTQDMFDNDWLNEVIELKNKYGNDLLKFTGFKAIGYPQILNNNCVIDQELINDVKKRTRNYAKRQITWCKNKFDVNYTLNSSELTNELIDELTNFIYR